MTRNRFSFGHRPLFKSPPKVIYLGDASAGAKLRDRTQTTETVNATSTQPSVKGWSLKRRIAALLAVIAVPAMAAPSDFGQLPGGAPTEAEMVRERLKAELERNPAMPFERPGMSFPGSAFFFLAEPPSNALIALPTADALTPGIGEAGREVGALIDAGPGASPFFSMAGTSHSRAQSCLAQAIWYEAASESEAGQRAVAQVVLNRVAHANWPNSVCGVVYQGSNRSTGCQFTFTCDGSLRRTASGGTWQKAQNLASEALAGSVYEPIGHATHYHTLWVNPYWASSLDHVGTIGAHRFYRNRGAGGRKDAFTQSYAGVEPGVRERVLAAPLFETQIDTASTPNAQGAIAGLPPTTNRDAIGPMTPGQAGTPSASLTGPGSVLVDQSTIGAGQVREDYARAGQWKSDAAREALQEDEQRRAKDVSEQSVEQGSEPR
ncbi:cell wall hydrolase [uncultured Erythrobacter sp.]|uniref:cell wall hydrolase n=1 Tax=uncultured Erythrobacter sp. TaxID=263913 RepID=UPI002629D981|nr:cell wall hydrolase [uncultured Erythrobacter sp.]